MSSSTVQEIDTVAGPKPKKPWPHPCIWMLRHERVEIWSKEIPSIRQSFYAKCGEWLNLDGCIDSDKNSVAHAPLVALVTSNRGRKHYYCAHCAKALKKVGQYRGLLVEYNDQSGDDNAAAAATPVGGEDCSR